MADAALAGGVLREDGAEGLVAANHAAGPEPAAHLPRLVRQRQRRDAAARGRFAKAVEEQRMLSEASIPGRRDAGNLSINGRREPVTATASAPNPMGLLEGQSSWRRRRRRAGEPAVETGPQAAAAAAAADC